MYLEFGRIVLLVLSLNDFEMGLGKKDGQETRFSGIWGGWVLAYLSLSQGV